MSLHRRWAHCALALVVLVVVAAGLYLRMRSTASKPARASAVSDAEAAAARDSGIFTPLGASHGRGISGLIRSSGGEPLPGAIVCAHRPEQQCCAASACRTTTAAGAFVFDELPSGQVVLTVAAVDHESKSQLLASDERRRVTITLERGGAGLAGVVEDAAGGVIPGALVVANYPDEPQRVAAVAVSDDQGRFHLTAPPTWLQVSASADGYTRGASETRAPDSNVRLILLPGASLAGRVVEQGTTSPVAGVLVTATKQGGALDQATARSDENGAFELTGLSPGPYELVGVAGTWRAPARWATAIVGAPVTDIVMEVEPATTLRGTVLVDGKPCDGGLVQLDGPLSLVSRVQRGGQVQVEGAALGSYAVSVGCEGAGELRETLELMPDGPARVWNVPSGLAVSGTLHDFAGRPSAGVSVLVNPVGSGGGASARCVSDASGRFSCAGLGAGNYVCYAEHAGRPASNVVSVAMDSGGAAPVALVLHEAATIRVLVRQPDGRPFDRVSVTAWRGGEQVGFGRRSGAGEFVFEALALGSYQVSAAAGPPDLTGPTVTLDRDGAEVSVTLQTPSTATLRGRVVDEDGGPVQDVVVRAVPSSALDTGSGEAATAMTGADGTFLLRDLLPEAHDLRASGPSGEAVLGAVRPGTEVEVRLASYGAISGVVRDRAGRPVESFVLSYEGAGQLRSQRVSDRSGAFRLPWLSPGDWQLSVRTPEGACEQKVAVAPGSTPSVTLTLAAAGPAQASMDLEQPDVKTTE